MNVLFDVLTGRRCVLGTCRIYSFAFLLVAAGCGESAGERPKPVTTVSWDASKLATLAFEKLDADKDGKLSSSEMSPGLTAALARIDSDKDGSISKAELENRLSAHLKLGAGLVSAAGTLKLGGAPVAGIKVTLDPEPFMVAVGKSASAVTDKNGDFSLQSEGSPLPAVQPGIYLIRLSSPDGKTAIPEKYAAATVLGVEISGDQTSHLALDLPQ